VRIHVPPAVQAEITTAADWYDNQQSGVGNEFGEALQDAFASILRDPESFPRHEQYPGRLDIRRCPLKRFPYDVIFLNRPAELRVIAVGHHQRDPLYWVDRLP
jgi:hypothetical protein